MDEVLAKAIVELEVPQFGANQKNKGDSPSCRFEPRHLLSSPEVLRYLGQRMAEIIESRCEGVALVGMATSGIAWASVASLYSGLPMLYIRKTLEPGVSENLLEGVPPEKGSLILVDDLIFDGRSKRQALAKLGELGYTVSDIVVIIDRQLQRQADGPCVEQDFGLKLHSLIDMEEIVDYMSARGLISDRDLQVLVEDYRRYSRWHLPAFAANPEAVS